MEAFDDSCPSMSDSFSLYERYMRSFNVVDPFLNCNKQGEPDQCSLSTSESDSSNNGNLNVHGDVVINQVAVSQNSVFSCVNLRDITPNVVSGTILPELCKPPSPCNLLDGAFMLESSCHTEGSCLTEKSDPTDVPVSSDESNKSKHPKPVIITSLITMENSNNAVDSVPMFHNIAPSANVFKLPSSELTFNGTIKYVQKLKPIVDPLKAFKSANNFEEQECLADSRIEASDKSDQSGASDNDSKSTNEKIDETSESTGDSQYQEVQPTNEIADKAEHSGQNLEPTYSSYDASFDSGVRSPDMFSEDGDPDDDAEPSYFWDFLSNYEAHDRSRVKKMEETLQGVPPPPSVTILKTDVAEMLKKYYSFLPIFSEDANAIPEVQPTTPTKLTSFIRIPETKPLEPLQEITQDNCKNNEDIEEDASNITKECHKVQDTSENKDFINEENASKVTKEVKSELEVNASINNSSFKEVVLPMSTEAEVRETMWPDVVKSRYFDVHYNITKYSERVEMLAVRCGERYIGGETDTSVTVYSGGLQSPSSACKRKAMRIKMAQAKSPGRRLSHLARRRQAFCSAATISDKQSTSKMVLIDRNFFPHRKLINTADRKSPRLRRTPGKRTPGRKTPGKKTPAKTPKTKSGGSTRKKAMRRLLLDHSLTRSQPTRETSKRALFVSPDNRKPVPQAPSTSVPTQAMKSKRALFSSPVRQAETKSSDGTASDQFLKRKRDLFDDSSSDSRSKIAKSLSFGGDSIGGSQPPPMSRRASEMFGTKNMAELDEHHRKKLLWAVSEALRIHGWRMQSPGFREKASSLARLTRRLLTLPAHAARLSAANLSTSETFLRIARQYVFAIIKGKTVEECFQEEQAKLAAEGTKVTGYISASAYQQIRNKPSSSATNSQIKENTCDGYQHDTQRSGSKNVLQDKLLNVDSNSNSSVGVSKMDRTALFKSNSMPSFEEAAKMRARRQISFDNVDFPKR